MTENGIARAAEELVTRLGLGSTADEKLGCLICARVVSGLDAALAALKVYDGTDDAVSFDALAREYMALSNELVSGLCDLSSGSTVFDHTTVWLAAGRHAMISDALLMRVGSRLAM